VAEKVKAYVPANPEDSAAVAAAAIEKVTIETKNASVDGYIPGFGYANANVAKVLNGQKVGEWGPVVETDQGAVMVKVISKKAPEEEAVASAIKEESSNTARFAVMTLFNDFVGNIEKSTPVENNLDLFYKD